MPIEPVDESYLSYRKKRKTAEVLAEEIRRKDIARLKRIAMEEKQLQKKLKEVYF